MSLSPAPQGRFDLTESGITIPSDSENYDANNEGSSSSSNSPMILYSPPTFWGIFRGAAINLLLPFINGLMLGFGELFAHEAAFRLGWTSTKVFPNWRSSGHSSGPGVTTKRTTTADGRRKYGNDELDMLTSPE
ncbi:hypothetical protein FKW77_008771 [Venturia effusa]|uniref:TOM13-domain-containing protein n=1 Tax=Venturia effusa TaxID=50376 RepID=A0A517KZZ7_9PEZI|nr:hypothetical protein FKW77_008771 [Venturia effusa]